MVGAMGARLDEQCFPVVTAVMFPSQSCLQEHGLIFHECLKGSVQFRDEDDAGFA